MADNNAAIETLLQTYAKHLNASDTSSIVPLYTKDGVFMAQHFPAAVGTTQVLEAYKKTFDLITLSVTFTIHEINVISDDYAIARTSSDGIVTVKGNGMKSNEGNQELFVLQKENGDWKIARQEGCLRKTLQGEGQRGGLAAYS